MTEPKITIIVPVYNAGKYIEKCNNSLINQTYKNLEIIYVNDGSTDNSLELLNGFAKQDNRIKVFNKSNGGVSSARNLALDNMQGEYVTFVDSDDYVDLTYIATLFANITENNADIACLTFETVDENGNSLSNGKPGEKYGDKIVFEMDDNYDIFSYYALRRTCMLLIKTSLFNAEPKIRYNVNLAIGEDKLVGNQLLVRAKRVVYNPLPLYKYVQNSESAMHKQLSEKRYSVILAHKKIVQTYKNSGFKKVSKKAKIMLAYQCYDFYNTFFKTKTTQKNIKRRLKKEMRKLLLTVFTQIDSVKFKLNYTKISFLG